MVATRRSYVAVREAAEHEASPTAAINDSQTAKAAQLQGPQAKSGGVRQYYAIALAGKAEFKLLGSSKVNAILKDTRDCPEGVWALPEKYSAIGESDRFVLKFAKPTEAK